MRVRKPLFVLVLALSAFPALAVEEQPAPPAQSRAGDVCLQNNRLWSWNVVNSRTLAVTDRTNRKYTVRLAGGCVGLTNLIPDIEIRGVGSLSCVRRGDFVRFVEPSLGRMSCAITAVEPAVTKDQPAKDN
jgi:hypothetical protein